MSGESPFKDLLYGPNEMRRVNRRRMAIRLLLGCSIGIAAVMVIILILSRLMVLP